ncbi:EpsI family protein [Rubrivivax sp. A210]|uniref:exosortase-associated protein EpsI, B-type n=1 Tax=Rubrivivax sp. A210 TaxID=2772301 RepID=UPI001918B3E4|nr:exosortase-associated protein EpsI, B-type [Rubrivivax sp. A210]CAD5369192.1 EpsI family protein [Rubrivivax sp. A210]
MNTTTATAPGAPQAGGTASRLHLVLAALLMLGCLALTVWFKPTALWSDQAGEPDLEAVVPKSFGNWVASPYGANVVVNPQQEEALRNIYSNTIARVYVHKPTGRQLLLSLAYGKDQTRDTQLHPPEACYRSQGFRVDRLQPEDITAGTLTLPAMRMDTVMGLRREYVTYWIRVGDRLARGSLERNLVRMRFAARGYIADGLLFRVSEITRDKGENSYRLQDEFMRELLSSVTPAGLDGLVGKRGP